MGMFDELQCKYPLSVDGANALLYQTKDTPSQYMDMYEIREDGTLWHEDYDVEDGSDPKAEPGSLASILGMMTRVNKRWVQLPNFTGEIRLFGTWREYGHGTTDVGCIQFSTYFIQGAIKHVELIKNTKPKTP